MAVPTPTIEIGLSVTDASILPFFTLGDATKGVLGNANYPLGSALVDVSSRVRSFRVNRGRSRDIANFGAGEVVITLNNFDRAFDPLYEASPYYGSIIPRRELRVTSDGQVLFTGWIDDWNLFYGKDGESLVDAVASDATALLAKQKISGFTPELQYTGERIETILSLPEIAWSEAQRTIDTGRAILSDEAIDDGANALQYMQLAAQSEPGLFFVGKDGHITFVQRNRARNGAQVVSFAQNGEDGIPFDNLQVVYGTELLYNEVTISRQGGGTAIASNVDSQDIYGIRELTVDGLLNSTDEQIAQIATNYAIQYSDPEFRFDSLDVKVHKLTPEEQSEVLGLEIGSTCKVTFTPNGIAPAIERYVEVIRIAHDVDPEEHIMSLGFRAVDYAAFVLGDSEFGRLGVGVLAW